nr:MAG TPA: hypothetical protein [Caudoviricetes sp.]
MLRVGESLPTIFHIKNFSFKSCFLQAKLIFNIFQTAVASKVSIRKRS